MDPRHLFMDKRLTGMCVYCGGQPDTRDHVPPKVLLDKPYPQELPVVGACNKCNTGASLDEQYLACFLECVLSGTTDPSRLQRRKIGRILAANPALRSRIAASQTRDEADNLVWEPEIDRIQRVIIKLARGHAAYELYPHYDEPAQVVIVPLMAISESERIAFEEVTSGTLRPWPELGSRAFMRTLGISPDKRETIGEWIVVQPGRYRYAVVEGGWVQMVLSEYLACVVVWE